MNKVRAAGPDGDVVDYATAVDYAVDYATGLR